MSDKINPDMIVLAREARGLNQTELAVKLDTTQGSVSKWEAGQINPSPEDTAAMSAVLDYPPSFFYQTDRVYGFGSPCFYHRKRTRMPVSELRQVQARLNIFRFHVTRLMRGIEIESENQFVRLDVDEHGGPEEVARLVRHQWGLPLGPVANVVNTVEHAGAIVFAMPFGTKSLDAISQVAPGCPPVIFINSEIPGDRLRFTLMHEVGHIIMHQLPSDNMEEQADRFAAEFLMPASEIKPALRGLRPQALPGLKHVWRTSMAALIKRAKDLGAITDRQYRSFMVNMSSQGWRTNEPVPLDVERPTVFKTILDVHLNQHGYTIADLSRMVNANESRFAAYLRQELPSGLKIVG